MKRSALLLSIMFGCQRSAPSSSPEPVTVPSLCATRSALTPLGDSASSSSVALGRLGERRVALLADEDDQVLRLIDLEAEAIVASVPLGGAPGHVLIDPHGRVHVSLPELDRVVELTATSKGLTECARTETPPEPRALAVFKDALLVATRGGLTMLGPTPGTIALSRDPEGILVTGSDALIAHRVGSIVSVVSLDRRVVSREVSLAWRDRVSVSGIPVADMPRFAVQAHGLARVGERVMVPMVLAYPGDMHVDVTFPSGYGAASVQGVDGYFPHEAAVSSFQEAGEKPRVQLARETLEERAQRVSRGRTAPKQPPCLLPRSVAAHHDELVVTCLGIDRLLVYRGDSDLEHAERARIELPSGPVALAVDGDDAVVWSQFARAVSVVSLTNQTKRSFAIAPDTARDVAFIEGRKTFHAPLAFDGRACASCHPDGGDDGLVWATPHGPLQPPTLAGRLDAAPFGWLGGAPTLEAHIGETMKRLMAKPMHKDTMDPLVAYLRAMKPRSRRPLAALEKRGRELFVSTEVGCASCHEHGGADGVRHDVGTGGTFDTPSLASLATSGPYMHDGRFATLREAIALDTMGSTKHLSDDDLTALVAYLKTL